MIARRVLRAVVPCGAAPATRCARASRFQSHASTRPVFGLAAFILSESDHKNRGPKFLPRRGPGVGAGERGVGAEVAGRYKGGKAMPWRGEGCAIGLLARVETTNRAAGRSRYGF